MSRNNILVFIEHDDGRIADVSLELISKADELARRLECSVEAAAVGHNLTTGLGELGQFGCRTVYAVEDPRLAVYSSLPFAKALSQIIRETAPRIVLFGATSLGRDLAPRIASELQCGLTADCTDLQIGDHTYKDRIYRDVLLQIRPAFGGNIIATIVSPDSRPSMATVREGVMKKTRPDLSRVAEVVTFPCAFQDSDFVTEVMESVRRERQVDLKAAPIVVAAGMGASSPEAFSLIKELARAIGGELGASRAAVDAGLLSKDHQVGQTGTTIRPMLYIACGISGQIQHRAGMSESKRIIAINKDPGAPIFEIAHYAIVGRVEEVIPRMIQAYRA